MKTYNRYKHCGETFYTGRNIEKIVCSECETQIKFDDIIKTKEPVSKQDNVNPVTVYESEEEIRQSDTE
jgi:hypothetical protein